MPSRGTAALNQPCRAEGLKSRRNPCALRRVSTPLPRSASSWTRVDRTGSPSLVLRLPARGPPTTEETLLTHLADAASTAREGQAHARSTRPAWRRLTAAAGERDVSTRGTWKRRRRLAEAAWSPPRHALSWRGENGGRGQPPGRLGGCAARQSAEAPLNVRLYDSDVRAWRAMNRAARTAPRTARSRGQPQRRGAERQSSGSNERAQPGGGSGGEGGGRDGVKGVACVELH